MGDGLDTVWNRFGMARNKPLAARFPGMYRALVTETNDPLRVHRVRFKIPELHDFDLLPEECQWAVTAHDMGDKRSGRWSHPIIGDWIWVHFEKGHPYGPVWTGFAPPTRRKVYPYASVYGKTPIPVDEKSDVTGKPNDFEQEYLPKDERPMSHGWADRYGNLDVTSSVGFFPVQHDVAPPPPDADNLTKSKFTQATNKPLANEPDSKFMARISKYGNMLLQSDIGYVWKETGGSGEFKGDSEGDEAFEIKRWKYLQKVIHEGKPKGRDQRKIMFMTRYGHRMEMRDVGWQHTRSGEFGGQVKISEGDKDERWIKTRTKGGHLIEQIDIGFDEKEDEFVKRLILDEVSSTTPLDKEDKFGDDARQIRIVARTGRKIVLDDRTSNKKKAQDPNLPNSEIGYGFLIKGRASPGASNDYEGKSGEPKGYFWEINEKPGKNHTVWGSPLGQIVEISDNGEAIIVCSRLPDLPRPCKFLEDNEFLEKSALDVDPEHKTHHLLIDLQREVIRLKSRAGKGQAPRNPQNGSPYSGENAGLEIHDAPSSDPWVEIIDHDKRGMWWSHGEELGIWRAKSGVNMYQWMDEKSKTIVIHNAEDGKIQIYCKGSVEIKSDGQTNIQAKELITLKAESGINMQVGAARYKFGDDGFDTNMDVRGKEIYGRFPQINNGNGSTPGSPSGSGASVSNISQVSVPTKEPSSRL